MNFILDFHPQFQYSVSMKNKFLVTLAVAFTAAFFTTCTDSFYIKKAKKLAEEKEYSQALFILNKKIKNKENLKYLWLHGWLLSAERNPQYRNAIEDYKLLETKDSQNKTICQHFISFWSWNIQEYEDAILYADLAKDIIDEEAQFYLKNIKADSYCNLGRYEEALKVYEELSHNKLATNENLLNYNTVKSIVNNDDSLTNFWNTLKLKTLTLKERDNLYFVYALQLLELGKVQEARDSLDLISKQYYDEDYIYFYKYFCDFLLNKNKGSDACMYLKEIEQRLKNSKEQKIIIYLDDLRSFLPELRFSTLYFYFKHDYERAKFYCSRLIDESKNLPYFEDISDINDVEKYFEHDRLFLLKDYRSSSATR